ncbi:RrF2 family transcriptional regulator [Marinobacterium rhizophilum]|uniref:RrF2 family transcriptional regulator n=1 Tax=Marinobacterium rhizophilum TaxID=420402 RepID=UPI00037CF571|nr:Rrf2 family transcriptional regulator [Marinobacterium rhizophilum]
MQLNKQTDYAIRVLIYLATAPRSKLCTIAQMASALNISPNNLAKIVNRFAADGLITTLRGRNGGMMLNSETLNFRMGDLVASFESDTELAHCEQPGCVLAMQCRWRQILADSLQHMLEHMNQYRLRDLLHDTDWLEQVLQIAPLPSGDSLT